MRQSTHTLYRHVPVNNTLAKEELHIESSPKRLSHRMFTVFFLCLDMFRYANTCHCITIAYSAQCSYLL